MALSAPRLTRRQWIAAASVGAIGIAAADAFLIEPNVVRVSRHRIGEPASSRPPARIVQITDLHLRDLGAHERRIAATVLELRPDVILITGDSVDDARNLGLLSEFLSMLETSAAKMASLGNWEHWAHIDISTLRREYERKGVQLLVNESATVTTERGRLLVAGLDDYTGGRPDLARAIAGAPAGSSIALLAHSPAYRDTIRSLNPGVGAGMVMFSGHTHGGQFAPFGWAPFRPPGSGRYVRGWYRDHAIPMYVSRGLGTSLIPARFFSPPEVALFEWNLAS